MNIFRSLFADQTASSAAEFGLVLPLLLALLFLSIDGGRYLYDSNRIEKATQFGARFAIVTNPVASDLKSTDYVGQTVNGVTLTQGDRIPAAALPPFSCTSTRCTGGHTFDSQAFTKIFNHMKLIVPELQPSNVIVAYSGAGLGYAGDPDTNSPQISPLVTVTISNLAWQPISGFLFINARYPAIGTTLSAEDSVGAQSF